VPKRFGVDDVTIYLSEENRVKPSLAQIPTIIEFLGRNPFETAIENQGGRISEYRRAHGLSQKKLAQLLKVDQSSIGNSESAENQPSKRLFEKLLSFFTSFLLSISKREK
jgi:DNA-binding XRE family transcriptional regulator